MKTCKEEQHMTHTVELIDIHATATMLMMSVPSVRNRIYAQRQGKCTGIGIPMPLSGQRRLCWLRSEVESYLLRLNSEANPQSQGTSRKTSTATSTALRERHKLEGWD
jgi:predicted DNA-binding transcriptional regulator AlpA